MRLMNKTIYCLILFLSSILSACSSGIKPVPVDTIPVGKPTTLEQIAACSEFGSQPEVRKYAFPGRHPVSIYVNNVVQRILDASSAQQKRIGLIVFNAPSIVNAGVTNNDCMLVFSGLVKTAKSEDELAFVMAHEIAHLLAEHPQQKSHTSVGTVAVKVLSTIVGVAADVALASVSNGATERNGLSNAGASFMSSVGDGLTTLRYSRERELEADRIALYITAKAGYDPAAAKGWFERMSMENSQSGFFSTHPNGDDRMENLDKYLPLALSYYNSTPKRPTEFQTMSKRIAKPNTVSNKPRPTKSKKIPQA